jgi:hypothetical protein
MGGFTLQRITLLLLQSSREPLFYLSCDVFFLFSSLVFEIIVVCYLLAPYHALSVTIVNSTLLKTMIIVFDDWLPIFVSQSAKCINSDCGIEIILFFLLSC